MPAAYSKICEADKTRLYESYKNGDDYLDLARWLGIKRTTAYHIIRRAQQNDGAVTLPRGGKRNGKVTDEMKHVLRDIVNEHPDYTLAMLNNEMRTRLPDARHVSTTTVSTALQGELITMKKLEDAPAERNSDATKATRHQYAGWLMENIQRYEFVFVDEAGINLWTKRTRGRARRGQRAVRVVQGRRGPNLTMTFAVSAESGLVHHELQEGGMTAERFNIFLNNVANRYHNVPHELCFVFDNARAHGRALNANLPLGCEVQYLPPYSPFLNICENAFSIWKQGLKQRLSEVRPQMLTLQTHQQRMATLAQLAEQETRAVTRDKMTAAFRAMQAYMPQCFDLQNIYM